jgi:uncharacterized protein (TIGR02646 family)
MKHIEKDLTHEPAALRIFRTTTPGARYSGYGDKEVLSTTEQSHIATLPAIESEKFIEGKRNPLKKAICGEQGFICCYCMSRISPSEMTVEHFIPQNRHLESPFNTSEHLAMELDYRNLLGSCKSKNRDCSEIRGNAPLKLDPRKPEIETLIQYKKTGLAFSENQEIDAEINHVLKLNPISVSDPFASFLLKNRRNVIDHARARMIRSGKENTWTKKAIQNEIEYWLTPVKGQFRPYCLAAVHYLRPKLRKAS